jgi:hypothetical protein
VSSLERNMVCWIKIDGTAPGWSGDLMEAWSEATLSKMSAKTR